MVKLGTVDLRNLDFVPEGVETAGFPPGFFDRVDSSPDGRFYGAPRLVTHIDSGAIAAVGTVYAELGVQGEVLDLMSSWISHFRTAPRRLVGLGLNADELRANRQLSDWVAHDLNADPRLPFEDGTFDHAVCCVSVDYLIHPVEVFAEVGRVLRPGGRFVVTFADRCFPTKAIRGWLATGHEGHLEIVGEYFRLSSVFRPAQSDRRIDGRAGDRLYAVWAARRS